MRSMSVFNKFRADCSRHSLALLAGVILLAFSAAPGKALAQTGSATIYVTGSIFGPTCSLTTSSITVNIGAVDKRTFTGVGSVSAWAPNQTLISGGCNATLVSMTFTGTVDGNDSNLFAAVGGATGVGIQLQKSFTNLITVQAIPNSAKTVDFSPAAAGGGYSFSARYVQTTATVTEGPANATVIVLITYT